MEVLKIIPVEGEEFARILSPKSKTRFLTVIQKIQPTSYRRYNGEVRKWEVHYSKVPYVVKVGKMYFDHVDYSELPRPVQILIARSKGSQSPSVSPTINGQISPYAILFLLPGAPWNVVQAAYKVLALEHHPDTTKEKAGAEERFRRIDEAYKTIKEDRGK